MAAPSSSLTEPAQTTAVNETPDGPTTKSAGTISFSRWSIYSVLSQLSFLLAKKAAKREAALAAKATKAVKGEVSQGPFFSVAA
jgi:hypothetical protein